MAEQLLVRREEKQHGGPADDRAPREEGPGPTPRQRRAEGRPGEDHDDERKRPGHRGGQADREEQHEGHQPRDRGPGHGLSPDDQGLATSPTSSSISAVSVSRSV